MTIFNHHFHPTPSQKTRVTTAAVPQTPLLSGYAARAGNRLPSNMRNGRNAGIFNGRLSAGVNKPRVFPTDQYVLMLFGGDKILNIPMFEYHG